MNELCEYQNVRCNDKNYQYNILIISRSVLLIMRNFSDKICRENRNTHFMFTNFFFLNPPVYEIILKNPVERGRPQMTIWRMRISYWIPRATNTHSQYVIFIFHCGNGCTNAPQRYVIRTLPVLFSVITL